MSLQQVFGWGMLRLLLAGIIGAHGWHRALTGGVQPFGQWLENNGWPVGVLIALAITAFEIIGTLFLALNRYVTLVCFGYVALYATGIAILHSKVGWFVVGPGRNGAEFSVLLLAVLVSVAVHHWPARR
jgi:putative oxidoreductase